MRRLPLTLRFLPSPFLSCVKRRIRALPCGAAAPELVEGVGLHGPLWAGARVGSELELCMGSDWMAGFRTGPVRFRPTSTCQLDNPFCCPKKKKKKRTIGCKIKKKKELQHEQNSNSGLEVV